MPSATVTVRELKNKTTGIDLSIPSFKEIPGLLGATVEYHVVVVSKLQYFKSPKHKESDVVQFMIAKQLDDFEEFRKKLCLKFPGMVFPNIPKKSLLLGESNVQQRKGHLETFVRHIACTPKLAVCPVTLEFLGVNSIKAGKYRSEETITIQDKEDLFEEEKGEKSSPQKNLFEELDEEEQDLFGAGTAKAGVEDKNLFSDSSPNKKSEKQEKPAYVIDPLGDEDDLFKPQSEQEISSDAGTRLFDVPDLEGEVTEDLLFVPGAKASDTEKKIQIEDNSDLLNIDDDFDKLLQVGLKPKKKQPTESLGKKPAPPAGKPGLKPKPPVGSKPTLAPKPGQKPQLPSKPKAELKSDTHDLFSLETDQKEDLFGADDLMKYIADNTAKADDDLDLFS